jgi:excisionase family DNA binding protein
MPWRGDFVKAFWLASQFGFGSTELADPDDERPPAKLSEVFRDDQRFPLPVKKIKVDHPTWKSEVGEELAVRGAVIEMRDRIGFKYERAIGLDDYVSQREAADLLRVPVMTVNRWIRNGSLKSTSKNGYSVLKLRDLLRIAKAQAKKVRVGGRIVSHE